MRVEGVFRIKGGHLCSSLSVDNGQYRVKNCFVRGPT